MKPFGKKEACCGCGACVDVCPKGAIRMARDGEGFDYPVVDRKRCCGCGRCREVCPVRNPAREKSGNLYFGVRAKEPGLRASGSSGGMFSLLAQYVFRRRGVVFGAAYNERMEVLHTQAFDMEGLSRLNRTKYVQSNMEGIYRRIEKYLQEERWVLFCGTPCQAQALLLFLKREYPRLIVADLVCYGVPSPGLWRSFVKDLEGRHGGRMTDFSFRDKRNGDNGHTCSYRIEGVEYVHSLHQDAFCKLYFKNFTLRPSCHSCSFCTVERGSDFTIGDFWGIERVRPDWDDGMGNSLVILHTDRAAQVWEEVKREALWFGCEQQDILQPRLQGPTEAAGGRGVFMMLQRILPFSLLLKLMPGGAGVRAVWRRRRG